MDLDLRTKLLISHYKCSTVLTAVREEVKAIDKSKIQEADDPMVRSIHRKLQNLRSICKTELRVASNADSPDSKEPSIYFSCDNMAMVFCKIAMGHMMINTTLLEFYSKCSTLSPPADNGIPSAESSDSDDLHVNEGGSWIGEKLSEKYLDVEIEGLFELVRSSFNKAATLSPLGWRGMMSTYRVLCAHARETLGYHQIWDRMHQLVFRTDTDRK